MSQFIKIGAANLPNIPKRDEYKFQLAITDPESGAAMQIAGWTFLTTLKKGLVPDDPDDENCAVRRFDTAPAGASSTAGKMIITLTGGDGGNTDLAPGEYVITCRRLIAGAEPWVALQQVIRVLATGAQNFTP